MKSRSNKILTIASVITAVGIVLLYFGYSQIGKLNQANNDLAVETSNLYVQAVRAEALKKIVSNAGDKGISLDTYFIQAGEEVEFVKKIESLAGSLNLTYTTNSIGTQSNEKLEPLGKEFLEMTMTTEGSWQNTRRFISLIEKMPMNIRINSIDLKTEIKTVVVAPTKTETISSTTPASLSPARTVWRTTIGMVVVKKK